MAANTAPITIRTPRIWHIAGLTGALNTYDGTTLTSTQLLLTGGSDGSFVERVRFQALGTNAATLIRLFANNGSAIGTAANNALINEWSVPASASSATAMCPPLEYTLNLLVQANYKLYVCIATAVAAGVQPIAFGGDF